MASWPCLPPGLLSRRVTLEKVVNSRTSRLRLWLQTGTLVDHWSDCGALIVVSVTDVSLRAECIAESMPIGKSLILLRWKFRGGAVLLPAWAGAPFLCIGQCASSAFIFGV